VRLTRGAVIAAGAGATLPLRLGAQTLEKIRVLGPPNDGFKAIYYGVESGIFKHYGLNVETSLVASGAVGSAAVIGGAGEVVYTNTLTLSQAHAHAVPLVYLAPGALTLAEGSPTFTLVRTDSPIHTGHDLNGKTVSSPALRDVNAIASMAWIDKNGGDSKTIHMIELPASVAAAALDEGRADAITMNEPWVSQALASGKVRVLARPYQAVGTRLMTAGFAAMAPVIERNTDQMSRFARGVHDAALYTNAHLPDTIPMVSRYTGMAPEVIAKSIRMVDLEALDPTTLQPLIDLSARYALIDHAFPATEIISSAAYKAGR